MTLSNGTPGPTITRRLFAAAGALTAVLWFLPPAGAPAAETKPLFEQVGTLERFPADARAAFGDKLVPLPGNETFLQQGFGGTVVLVPTSRLLVQVFPDPVGADLTVLAVRDLDTLRITGAVRLNARLLRTSVDPAGGGDWAHALDKAGTRLWMVASNRDAVHEVDLRTFATRRWPLPASILNPFSQAFQLIVGGMTYDPWEDDLFVLYGGPATTGVANANVLLYRLDVSKPPPTSFATADVAKLYRLRSCTGPVGSTEPASDTSGYDILVTRESLYVPCMRAGHTVVVVRTPRPDPEHPESYPRHPEDVTAGPVYGEAVLADQGGGRLFVMTTKREIWAFETATMSFVGVVATGPADSDLKTGYGLDPATGRVYFQSRTFGLGVIEGRFFPIPQARTMPRLTTGQDRIWSDAATNRVFVLEGDTLKKAPAWRIYRVPPAPVPPAAPDPDRNTADIDEKAGVTEARYNASGSGYGTRVLLAKGIAAVPPAPVLGVNAPTAEQLYKEPRTKPCDFADRDLFAGRVARAEYDTGSTAAKAVAVAVDGNTEQDLNKLSRCNAGLVAFDAERWNHKAAECASNLDHLPDKPSEGEHKTSPVLGPSTAKCPKPGEPLDAFAETKFSGGSVEVQHSWTHTTIRRDGAGVTAVVESVAEGVKIGGSLHIGEIRSKATSNSNGRPRRKDMSTHDITFADVRFGDTPVCGNVCDPVEMEETLNLLAAGRAVFRTGHGDNSGRDEDLVEGSRRGAQTAVQKSVARQASDRALIGDFTVEVPALEVTVFNDNTKWGRARQLYQFAGVATSATYNIVVNPTGAGFDDLGPDPVEDLPTAEADGTLFEDLLEVPVEGTVVLGPTAPAASDDGDADADGDGGLVGVVKAVVRGLRLFLTSPRTALLLLTAWALLGSPAVLGRRRRLLAGIRSG